MQVTPSPKPSRQGFTLIDQSAERGFTLIELSIVLVIIGLIVGGILTGQSIIKQAALRSTLTEITNITTMANAFHDRYNGLPGDLATYASIAMATPSGSVTSVGDGLLEDKNSAGILAESEIGAFFNDLTLANMYSLFSSTGFGQINEVTTTPLNNFPLLPSSGLGANMYVWVASGKGTTGTNLPTTITGVNYYRIGKITAITAPGAITDGLAVAPADAAAIDSKLDDGVPNTGQVLAYNSGSGDMKLTVIAGGVGCVTAAGVYNTNTAATTSQCSLAIATGF